MPSPDFRQRVVSYFRNRCGRARYHRPDRVPPLVAPRRFVALFHSDFEIDYAKSRYKGLDLHEAPPAEEDRG